MKSIATFLAFFLMVSVAQAQYGKDSGHWDFKTYDKISKSVVRIGANSSDVNSMSAWSGSGTVFKINPNKKHATNADWYECHILTANHVSSENPAKIVIHYQTGSSYSGARIVCTDKESDLSIIVAYCHKDHPCVKIATTIPKIGDVVRVCGYGRTSDVTKPRYYEAKVARVEQDGLRVYVDEDTVWGDSGGGIFNADGELIGCVSGGCDIMKSPTLPRLKRYNKNGSQIFNSDGTPATKEGTYTWPIRGGSVGALRKLCTISIFLKPSEGKIK